jgi:inhibitor of KinA sporulation pathway (predicted exonuclease)
MEDLIIEPNFFQIKYKSGIINMTEQPFDYLIILDFEATCDDNKPNFPNEIIEFPMVLIETKSLSVLKTFREYIRPTLKPKLTKFCTELTGITQETVDKSQLFNIVFKNANRWIESVITEYEMDRDRMAFVTHGDWDLNIMLPNQCKLYKQQFNKEIKTPYYFKRWINIKVPCKLYLNKKQSYGMLKILESFGLTFIGRQHSGLDDSINIANITLELIKRGQILEITGNL